MNKRKPVFNNDVLAGKIAGCINRCKQRTVRMLQRCEDRCTLLQKKIILIVFILFFGGYCAWTLLQAFYPHQNARLFMPRIITVPASPWLQNHPIHKPNNH